MPKIIEVYGKDAFSFRDNAIVVTIPYDRIDLGNATGGIPSVETKIPPDNTNIPPVVHKGLKPAEIQELITGFCEEPKGILQIADYLDYKDKKTVRRYLDPLIDQGRIAMTIPDKPNSKNQKYVTIK